MTALSRLACPAGAIALTTAGIALLTLARHLHASLKEQQ